MRRVSAVIVAAVTLVVAAAMPVWAHGSVNVNASIQSVVLRAPAGVSVWVHADGSLITLETSSTVSDVQVLGYSNEPFLRFAAGEVFDNVNSLTTYATTSGVVDHVAAGAGHGPTRWRSVRSGSTYSWSDGRVDWMEPQLPTDVSAAPDKRHDMGEWSIPVLVDGKAAEITGHFVWVPAVMSAGATTIGVVGVLVLVLGVAGWAAFPRRPVKERRS